MNFTFSTPALQVIAPQAVASAFWLIIKEHDVGTGALVPPFVLRYGRELGMQVVTTHGLLLGCVNPGCTTYTP